MSNVYDISENEYLEIKTILNNALKENINVYANNIFNKDIKFLCDKEIRYQNKNLLELLILEFGTPQKLMDIFIDIKYNFDFPIKDYNVIDKIFDTNTFNTHSINFISYQLEHINDKNILLLLDKYPSKEMSMGMSTKDFLLVQKHINFFNKLIVEIDNKKLINIASNKIKKSNESFNHFLKFYFNKEKNEANKKTIMALNNKINSFVLCQILNNQIDKNIELKTKKINKI